MKKRNKAIKAGPLRIRRLFQLQGLWKRVKEITDKEKGNLLETFRGKQLVGTYPEGTIEYTEEDNFRVDAEKLAKVLEKRPALIARVLSCAVLWNTPLLAGLLRGSTSGRLSVARVEKIISYHSTSKYLTLRRNQTLVEEVEVETKKILANYLAQRKSKAA